VVYLVFHDPIAFHPANRVCDADADDEISRL
jgi:hypothetical protein